ncbi:protein NifQ [Methyloglobulus morosus KoM1]|uniref:Protein NifQ n=1 Tax=Methyloglobulus morosus KoM1 TaxID=1116472 RepID=V5C500_9GAMM|nr:nitrogen fixation protein NifQ [Methyloglobulus morosus]ESS73532.1 protein NifQ [Methyloglobulus morosus KoM1]
MLAKIDAYQHYDPLLVHARAPSDPVTQTFAAAINMVRSSSRLAGRLTFGLEIGDYKSLIETYFPGAQGAFLTPALNAFKYTAPTSHGDEFDDVLALLLEHRGNTGTETTWLAYAVTACCMGDDHLWQDMGLNNRQELSGLMQQHFSTLYEKNTGNMRWKKFFYKQLCERAGAYVCRSPSCAVCVDYQNCFGSEEEGLWR